MDAATLQKRLDAANQQSVKLYLRRQEAQQQAQAIQLSGMQIDAELLRLDGEIRVYESLMVPDAK